MSGIIIYKSKYGSTRKYAEWLKEATGFVMAEAGKIKIGEVAKYDTIIYGGGIFAGGITGISFIKKNVIPMITIATKSSGNQDFTVCADLLPIKFPFQIIILFSPLHHHLETSY